MKITDIKQQEKDKNRYSIFVDNEFAFGLSELGLINSGLKINQEISKNELEKLKDEARIDKTYNLALALIARRPRSEWEMTDYLRRKGLAADEVDEIINKLREKSFINDEDFAKRWVENRRLLKSTSKRKLQLELKQKRVSENIIKRTLETDETDEREVLKELITKKRSQARYKDDQKLIAYLARQGFRYDDIKDTLGSIK